MHTFITSITLIAALGLSAQETLQPPRFPQGAYFRRHFREQPARLRAPFASGLAEAMTNGRLELPMRDYLELVLSNNTEIQIQRLSVEPLRNAITRASAPFDASVTASFQTNRSATPSYTALEGAETVTQLRQPVRFLFQQTLETGTQYTVGFEGSRSSTNNAFATFNPALSANVSVGVSQPLLRNRGRSVNRLPILIARTQYGAHTLAVEHRLRQILEEAQQAYWAVVRAREELRVQERSLEFLAAVIKRHKRELELGELAPADVYESEQAYAARNVLVSEARNRLQQAEHAIRYAIGATADPVLQSVPLVLTEAIAAPDDDTLDIEGLIGQALRNRADLKAARLSLQVDDMLFQQSKNALLPDVSLTGSYLSAGRGGRFLQRNDLFSAAGSAGDVVRTVPGGLGDALAQVLSFAFPTWAVGLNLRLPIRDSRAAADLADAAAARKIDTFRVRGIQEQIRLDVLSAITRLVGSRTSVKLAQIALDIAKKRVETEQKKYDRGISTVFFLLDAQTSMTRAEADLVARSVQYQMDVVNLRRATATLPSGLVLVVR